MKAGRDYAWAAAALGVLCFTLAGCPPPSGPEGPAPPQLDVPVPSETDLRDFHGDDREAFLGALEDLRRGRVGRAERELGDLGESIRDSPALRAAMALSDLGAGGLAGPLEALRRESERATHSRFVLLCYATAAEAAGEPEAAYAAVEAAMSIGSKGVRGAEPEVDEALRARSGDLRRKAASARLRHGTELLDAGAVEDAVAELERAARADPNLEGALATLGAAQLRGGDAGRAAETLEKAQAVQPDDLSIQRNLASACLKAGRLEDARRIFGEVLARAPLDPEAKAGLEEARSALRRQALPARFRDLIHMPFVTRGELAALLFENMPELKAAPQTARGVVVTDVAGSWAKDYVLMAVSRNVMAAYDDHTFGAEEHVSRADLADALARAVESLERSPGELAPAEARPAGAIEDLPRGHGRYESIVAALNYGLMGMTEDRAFRPAEGATGREAVEAVERLRTLVTQER